MGGKKPKKKNLTLCDGTDKIQLKMKLIIAAMMIKSSLIWNDFLKINKQ